MGVEQVSSGVGSVCVDGRRSTSATVSTVVGEGDSLRWSRLKSQDGNLGGFVWFGQVDSSSSSQATIDLKTHIPCDNVPGHKFYLIKKSGLE